MALPNKSIAREYSVPEEVAEKFRLVPTPVSESAQTRAKVARMVDEIFQGVDQKALNTWRGRKTKAKSK